MQHRSFVRARGGLVLALALLVGTVGAQVAEPIAQDAPVEISAYSTWIAVNTEALYIEHTLGFTNASDQAVVALSFGVISFDAFWDHIGTSTFAALERIEAGASVPTITLWQYAHELTTYPDLGSSFAFIHRVRFEDGTVWKYAPLEVITALIRQAPEAVFDPARFP